MGAGAETWQPAVSAGCHVGRDGRVVEGAQESHGRADGKRVDEKLGADAQGEAS